MTAEQVLQGAPAEHDDGRMFCYRHPDRETWLRCGRCDQPICTKCSVLGPVGARCRVCGLRPNDSLASFSPRQLLLGSSVAVGTGLAIGFIGPQLGWLSILGGFFAGGFAAEAFVRVVGYKRGPVMVSILFGGLVAGVALGFAVQLATFFGAIGGAEAVPVAMLLQATLPGVLISAGAACFGAYSRLR